MRKYFKPFIAFLTLSIAILACALPIPSVPPVGTPAQSYGTATPPFSPDDVGTVVALTLTGMAPGTGPTPGTDPNTDESAGLLPHAFYYLGTDSAGLTQVFRIERDGTTGHQITSEPVGISDYDVSLTDGSVAYVANNQLLWINADSSDCRVIVDAGAVDPNNPFITNISSPVFSPDGTKLLITLGYYEGASAAVYYPATNALVRLEGGEGALICCDEMEWSADSLSFYSASPSMGMFSSGLWKVDAPTGKVLTLIPGDAGGGNYNAADEPYLAPDGQLYFFFTMFTGPDARSPLQLVRAASDGVTGRTVVSGEDFQLLNEALWAPDASFVIAAFAPAREVYQGGQAEIVYFDGKPGVVLTPFAQQMKWGP